MEDVEVSMRLTSIGETLYLGREWKVSAQKWEKNLPRRILLIIRLVATYQLARLRGRSHAAVISEKMYREYYPDTQSQR
jgi:hypothetical protein